MCIRDSCYPVCPYCKLTLAREYQHFCERCGQELDWKDYSNAIIIVPSRSGSAVKDPVPKGGEASDAEANALEYLGLVVEALRQMDMSLQKVLLSQ